MGGSTGGYLRPPLGHTGAAVAAQPLSCPPPSSLHATRRVRSACAVSDVTEHQATPHARARVQRNPKAALVIEAHERVRTFPRHARQRRQRGGHLRAIGLVRRSARRPTPQQQSSAVGAPHHTSTAARGAHAPLIHPLSRTQRTVRPLSSPRVYFFVPASPPSPQEGTHRVRDNWLTPCRASRSGRARTARSCTRVRVAACMNGAACGGWPRVGVQGREKEGKPHQRLDRG